MTNQRLPVLLLLALGACAHVPATPAAPAVPAPLIRRATQPAQRTLVELRALYEEPIVDCALPRIAPEGASVALVTADGGLKLRMPAGWDAPPRIDSALALDTIVTAVWRHPQGHRISATRVVNGATGPAWLQQGTQRLSGPPTCVVAAGDAGVIWRLYDPAGGGAGVFASSWNGTGEAITADSLRFQFTIRAPSAGARDSLAGRIAEAVLHR